jgi:hypothetical protein
MGVMRDYERASCPLLRWDCNGSPQQQWIFTPGSWRIESALAPGKCIDVPGDDTDDGTQLWLWGAAHGA